MTLNECIDKVRFMVTGGGILQCELPDESFKKLIETLVLPELTRYYDGTKLITVEAKNCIDLSDYKDISAVTNIFRTEVAGGGGSGAQDPMVLQQWQMFNMGSNQYVNSWLNNLAAFNTYQQIANTISTDLQWYEDKASKKLYVTLPAGRQGKLSVEYVPILKSVEDVVGDYWTDILTKLTIAQAKILIGTVRTRFTQTGAQWQQNGEKVLEEGHTELNALRERLVSKSNVTYPMD